MTEGANFAEYPMTKSDSGIKSQELKNSNEKPTGYTSVTANLENKPSQEGAEFAEYPTTQSVGLKSTIKAPVENKPNLTTSTGYGATGEYTSVKLENKPSQEGAEFAEYPTTQSVGLKSTINASVENKPNLTSSTGYNSMEGEYKSSTSGKIENKPSKEGAEFAEYPTTQSVGLKSTVNASVENKPNLTTSIGYGATGEYTSVKLENKPLQEGSIPTAANVSGIKTSVNQTKTEYNSMTGGYSSSSTTNNMETKNSVNQSQTPVLPLIVKVPANAPIINNTVPLGTSVTYTTTTITTSVNPGQPMPILQTIPIVQQMPVGQPIPVVQQIPLTQSIPVGQPISSGQPLTATTFAEYPATTSVHGIKSNDAQPK